MDLKHSKTDDSLDPPQIYIHDSKSTDFIKPKGSVETIEGQPGM